jgi:hypothetical protein
MSISLLVLSLLAACAVTDAPRSSILVAHLGDDPGGLERVRTAFRSTNPGYDLAFHRSARSVAPVHAPRVLFVQAGAGEARVGAAGSSVACGDIVLLRPNEELHADAPLDLLAFSLPAALPAGLPSFVRPDWDPNITDRPGGCATETGAYRRILLTWLEENGTYLCHSLNAHRVRIADSFTHYHPREGGFDEFYLVQMVQPGARILTSDAVDAIEARSVTTAGAGELFDVTQLAVGDLVYLPRGTIHRGLGGVLAQVIAAPGFRPGTEIGVDAHLAALNDQLGLEGDAALPYHRELSSPR